jgi:alpha-N-arabinofuranosidase
MGALRARNGHPEPYNVGIVEIGNELFGWWQVGHCDADEYARRYQAFFGALNKRFPDIHYIANGAYKWDKEWNETLLRVNKSDVSSVSIHYLFDKEAAPLFSKEDFVRLAMAQAYGMEEVLNEHKAHFDSHAPGIKMAVTELMLYHQMPPDTYPKYKSFPQILWYSGFINSCMRQGDFVEIITHTASMNHGASMEKVDERIFYTPGWLGYTLYTTAEGNVPCSFTLNTPYFPVPGEYEHCPVNRAPVLDAFALVNESQSIMDVFIANRSLDEGFILPVTTLGANFESAIVHQIAGDDIMDKNTAENSDKIRKSKKTIPIGRQFKIKLPKLSLTRITLKK